MRPLAPAGLVLIAALALVMLKMPALESFDLWWHLRTGEVILQTGAVPVTDPFSHPFGGQPWVTHEWGSEVLLALLHRAGGLPLLLLVRGLLIAGAAAVVFSHLHRRLPARTAAIAVILFLGASHPAWNVRPGAFTVLLAAITLVTLEGWRRAEADEPDAASPEAARRRLWALPALVLLWANLHGGFALGIGLVGLYGCLAWAPVIGRPGPGRVHLAGVLAACFVAACINPSGPALLLFPLSFFAEPHDFILEWAPTSVEHTPFLIPLVVVLVLALGASPRRPPAHSLVVLAVLITLGLKSIRHLPFFGLGVAVLAAEAIGGAARRLDVALARSEAAAGAPTDPGQPAGVSPGWRAWVIPVAGVLVLSGLYVSPVGERALGPRMLASEYPVAAVDAIEEDPPPGKMFNYYDWGGYLIWRLHPEHPVFVDGRADMYGVAFVKEVFQPALSAQPGWEKTLREHEVGWVLVPPDQPIALALAQTEGWTLRHRDAVSVLWVREAP